MQSYRRLLLCLGLDLAAWGLVPALFLILYVERDLLHQQAVLPHLRVVLWLLLGLALVRLLLCLPGIRPATARFSAALIASVLLAVMIAYYALVLIGLQSWGRVVSWDLIVGYSGQVLRLADALGIHLGVALGALALGWLALLAAAWGYLRLFDWTPFVRRQASGPLLASLLAGGAMVWAIELYDFTADPRTEQAEPVSLTLFPLYSAWNLQGHAVDKLSAAKRDAAEDAVRSSYAPDPGASLRNVILIVVDALRPDHMGVYGYARNTTPHLARLEEAGLVRKAASVRAACASSLCGLLSLSASRFVHQFSQRPMTLQEVLRRHGYRIHMILGGDHTQFYGLRQAYGEVDSYFDGRSTRTIRYINDDRLVLDRLAEFPAWDGRPAMLQLHLMSAHLLGWRDPAVAKYAPAAGYSIISGRDNERTVNFYDNGVLQADSVIAGILETLQRKGYLQNAVVAITADHGESLGEHGLFQHANSVREEVLRVPFLLLSYGYRPAQPLAHRALASQVDLAPTLLAELGVPRPSSWTGAPLQEPVSRDFLYFQELAEVGLYDLRDARNLWKYWIDTRGGGEYAFNLTRDPGERTNALDSAPPEARREWRLQALARSGVRVGERVGGH